MKSVMKKNQERKIIWAIDPSQKPSYAKNLIVELEAWSRRLNCPIQPVAVFSEKPLNLPIETFYPGRIHLEEIADQSLSNYLKKTNLKNFLPPEKIFIGSNSIRKMAKELAKYAEEKNALIIFANTRARKSWNPFHFGGFSETLVTISRIPVLLLNPKSRPSINIPSILFPTNFDQDSTLALTQLISFAKAFQAKITLYSQIENPTIYMAEFSGYWPSEVSNTEAVLQSIERTRMEKAKKWSRILADQNIASEIILARQKKSLSSDILDKAKKKHVSLIALANSSGPLAQALMGGVARDILLQAKCPVLVFYQPRKYKKATINSMKNLRKDFVSKRKSATFSRMEPI